MKNLPRDWQLIPNDQKVFVLPETNVMYLIKQNQQRQSAKPMEMDSSGLPVLFFRGIRVQYR